VWEVKIFLSRKNFSLWAVYGATTASHVTFVTNCRLQTSKFSSSSYNKSQQDALFLGFILVKNSTCFGQIYCPSSGVLILYSQQIPLAVDDDNNNNSSNNNDIY